MDALTIIPILIAAIIAAIFGHAAYLKRKDKDALDSASNSITEMRGNLHTLETRLLALETLLTNKVESLDKRVLSEARIKALIVEETRELKGEIKALSELISKLRIDLGILNYINSRESTRDD